MIKEMMVALALTLSSSGVLWAQNSQQNANSLSFPGGANTVQESFENWTVNCAIRDNKKLCSIAQQQLQNNGQRIVTIEIMPGSPSRAHIVLPFGFRLQDGLTYRIDNSQSRSFAISACYQDGCLAMIDFTDNLITALRNGQNLIISGKAFDNNQDVTLTISLKGFGAGLDRAVALRK